MRLASYIKRSPDGVYYFRVVIPPAFRPALAGRRELRRSLRTRDPMVARWWAYNLAGQVRAWLRGENTMSVPDIDNLLASVKSGRINTYRIDVRKGIFEADMSVPGDHEAMLQAMERLQQTGALGQNVQTLPAQVTLNRQLPAGSRPSQASLLSETIKHYEVDLLNRTKNLKTRDDYRRTLTLFQNLIGDKPMYQITSGDVARFEEYTQEHKLAPKTAQKRLTTLHTFFGWARAHDRFPQGMPFPTDYMSQWLRRQHTKQVSRQHFNMQELKNIFKADHYKVKNNKQPAWFWVPILGLFTGARIEELVQLCIGDVKWDANVECHYLDINNRDGKSIKNKNSIRKIPLHPQVIELGFLDYVSDVRECGFTTTGLFPYLQSDKYGRYSSSTSKHFLRYLRSINILDSSRVFHSFRHTVGTQLRNCGVQSEIRHSLLGHALGEGEHATYIHEEIPLEQLFRKGIACLRYEETVGGVKQNLDLTVLKYMRGQFVGILKSLME